jgi:hypothetical protein
MKRGSPWRGWDDYLGLSIHDANEWERFAAQVLRLQVNRCAAGSSVFLLAGFKTGNHGLGHFTRTETKEG